jgi:hypothetical protein
MTSVVLWLRMSKRKSADIATVFAPAFAIVKWLPFVGMDVGVFVADHPGLNNFNATEALGGLCELECLVPFGERSFDRHRCCIDLAYSISRT